MKKIKSRVFLIAACVALFLSNCKKVKDLKPPPTVDPVKANAMYPATRLLNQQNFSRQFKYEYDANNNLIKYGKEGTYIREIGPNSVKEIGYQYNGLQELSNVSTRTYAYSLANGVTIYAGLPTQVDYSDIYKDMASGAIQTTANRRVYFAYTKDGLLGQELSSEGQGYNHNYGYDKNGNLQVLDVVQNDRVTTRIKVTSVDDKYSPFSHVKGYWLASYSPAYAWDYAEAFCKNNPIQMTIEGYDISKKALVINEKDDFTYTYNAQGYPITTVVNTTYYGAVETHYTTAINYTYK